MIPKYTNGSSVRHNGYLGVIKNVEISYEPPKIYDGFGVVGHTTSKGAVITYEVEFTVGWYQFISNRVEESELTPAVDDIKKVKVEIPADFTLMGWIESK